ncbi:protein JINGUBANG-like [Diospyros lotus]|uniref:protein JINGUBANG-like n=1 Tax=Diospyros lotus TaxID=55363 RepID=UPI0022587C8C|nr:protein JINGUBANG-like [Diospyros lotus]
MAAHLDRCSEDEHQCRCNLLHHHSSSLNSQLSLPSLPSLTTGLRPAAHYHCIATFKPHHSYTSSLALAGKFLHTGSSDKQICLWKCATLTSTSDHHDDPVPHTVEAGNGAIKSLVVLADKLFSAHQDHKIRVWRIDGREADRHKLTRLATLPTLGDRAAKILVPKNHVEIRRHKKSTWVHHVDAVSGLALSSDETLLYSVSWDRTLKIWRTGDFRCLESVRNAHDDAINAVTASPDGRIYTGSADKKIKVWERNPEEKKHTLVAVLEKHNSGINALAVSGDGAVLYSGACDRSIVVWEKREEGGEMAVAGALRGHSGAVLCLAVKAELVFSGSADRSVRVWRRIGGGGGVSYCCLAVVEGHAAAVKCLAVGYNQSEPGDATSSCVLYTGSLDSDVKVWRISCPVI